MNEKELDFILQEEEGLKIDYRPTTLKTTLKTEDKILALIKENQKITKEELAKQLHITTDGIKYHIKKLRKKKIILWKGPSKNRHWEIVK